MTTFWIFIFLLSISVFPFDKSIYAQELTASDLLELSFEDLLDVTVTSAGKKEQKVSEVPASVVVISRDDIKKYGYKSLEEILENVPGLYKIDNWEVSEANFGIRGFLSQDAANRNIIFLVNGVRQNENFQDMNRINTINVAVEAIDRIEVIRGPVSVIYGTGAFFGVINIVTNEVEKRYGNILSGSIGSDNTYELAFRTAGKETKFNYAVNASFYKTGGHDFPYSKVGYNLRPGSTAELLKKQTHHVDASLSHLGFYTRISFDESYNARTYLFQPPINYNGENHFCFTRIQLGKKEKINNWLSLDGKIGYYNFDATIDADWGTIENAMEFQDIASQTFEFELISFLTPVANFDLTLGFNHYSTFKAFSYIDIPAFAIHNGYYYLDDAIKTNSLYAQAAYNVSDKLSVIGGIRLENQSKYDLVFENNLGMSAIDPDNYQYTKFQHTYEKEDLHLFPVWLLYIRLIITMC